MARQPNPRVTALIPKPATPIAHTGEEEEKEPGGQQKYPDIWNDGAVLRYLQLGSTPPGTPQSEEARIKRRASAYSWRDGKLYRQFRQGGQREVPPPQTRRQLVEETHQRTGHWGAKRTAALLATSYWWAGMAVMAAEVNRTCEHCQRVKTTFNGAEKVLHPMSVEGFCYRWSVDLAGPFQPVTSKGNKYVMIAVEHYTKHLEAVPIPDNTSATVAYAFAHNVLARFGACAEVVSDNGSEFEGAFHTLLAACLIDHRYITPHHPQANGLAERAVQSVKRALRKMVEARTASGQQAQH